MQLHASASMILPPPPLNRLPCRWPLHFCRSEQTYMLRTNASGDSMYTNELQGNRILEFGTTATVACLQGDTIVVANAGDTKAVLGRCGAGAGRNFVPLG
jgi:serine/threonine protein phosphatase PrpC